MSRMRRRRCSPQIRAERPQARQLPATPVRFRERPPRSVHRPCRRAASRRAHRGARRRRSRHAGHSRIRDDPHLHGADHDEAPHPDGGAHHRPHGLRAVRRRWTRARRHGHRGDRQPRSDRRPVDVRDHVLRDHDRRRALRPARPVHRPCARQRPGEDRRRYGSPRWCGVTRRRRVDDLHRDDRRHAADLPAARHEPGRPDLCRRARERHVSTSSRGGADRPSRLGPGRLAHRDLRPDAAVARRRTGARLRLRLVPGAR